MTEAELHKLMKKKMHTMYGTRIEDSIGSGTFDCNWTYMGEDAWVDYKIFGSGCRNDCFKIRGSQVRWVLNRYKVGSTNAYFLAAHKDQSNRKYTLHLYWAWRAVKEAIKFSRQKNSLNAILFQHSDNLDMLKTIDGKGFPDQWATLEYMLFADHNLL